MVGDIVLFKIDELTRVDLLRPLLVVAEHEGTVTGQLFLDWESDRISNWCRAHCFYSGAGQHNAVMVFLAKRGSAIGEWRPKPVPMPKPGGRR